MRSFYGKAWISLGLSIILAGISWFILPQLRAYSIQIVAIFYVVILIFWRPILVPGDITLKDAMHKKPGLAVQMLLGMIGVFVIACIQVLIIYNQQD